jgi:hypothetical protein
MPPEIHQQDVASGTSADPQVLTLKLPQDKTISFTARSSSFISHNGIVLSVFARRPVQPIRFQAAKADLLQALAQLNIQPDEQMNRQMSAWTGDIPGYGEKEGMLPYDFKTGVSSAPHDSITITAITRAQLDLPFELIVFNKTSDNSMTFTRITFITEEDRPDYHKFTLSLAGVSNPISSGPGDFNPYVLKLDGPNGLLANVQSLTGDGAAFPVGLSSGVNSYLMKTADGSRPAVLLMTRSAARPAFPTHPDDELKS